MSTPSISDTAPGSHPDASAVTSRGNDTPPSGIPPHLHARLNDPKIADALGVLLDNSELLALLVQSTGQLLARGEDILENVTESVGEFKHALGSHGVNLPAPDALLANAGSLASTLAATGTAALPIMQKAAENQTLEKLNTSAVFNPELLTMLDVLAKAVTTATQHAAQAPSNSRVTPMSLIKDLRDPDVSRAITFSTTLLKALGQELDPDTGNFSPTHTKDAT